MATPDSVLQRFKEIVTEITDNQQIKSKRAFALAIGADPSHFNKVLDGTKDLPPSFTEGLQNAFKVRPEFIWNGTGEKYGTVPHGTEQDHISIREHIEVLNKHNRILEDVIKSNLTALATTQHIILAQIKAGQKYHVRREAKGNKKQEVADLLEISTFSRDYFEAMTKVGMNAEEGM